MDEELPRFQHSQTSLTGDRKINQDRARIVVHNNRALLVLADGLGGHPKGEEAAQILIDTCAELFEDIEGEINNHKQLLEEMLVESHHRITDYGYSLSPPIEPRTTAVLCLIDANSAYWVHVGDSRLYLIRDSKILTRTLDHSYVQSLLEEGMISEEEIKHHPHRNYVTRCLGGTAWPPEPTFGQQETLQVSDTFVACSDGFWEHLDDNDMAKHMSDSNNMSATLLELSRIAADIASPHSDNVTANSIRVERLMPEKKETTLNLNNAISALQNAIKLLETKAAKSET